MTTCRYNPLVTCTNACKGGYCRLTNTTSHVVIDSVKAKKALECVAALKAFFIDMNQQGSCFDHQHEFNILKKYGFM